MRQKELRIALVCYGGISLAVYMHGVTKEIWHLNRASGAFHGNDENLSGVAGVYGDLLAYIERNHNLKLRVLTDILSGASAGGINAIFLSQAIYSGQSLDALTDLWLEWADVDHLIDPDARPVWKFAKFWMQPFVWFLFSRRGNVVSSSVAKETRAEVRRKVSQLVRCRWFAPPFSGEGFTKLLLNALGAMKTSVKGPALLPPGHPLDLFVSVTDFYGHAESLRLHSPAIIEETEHRLPISFCARVPRNDERDFAHILELTMAARATASFPGAFPPLQLSEIENAAQENAIAWETKRSFLERIMPTHLRNGHEQNVALIDGAVLVNKPFDGAIKALSGRPAQREVDRRFVYIDPRPERVKPVSNKRVSFFGSIFGSLSTIPREQPIRDNLEQIANHSREAERLRRMITALRPEVDQAVEKLFGRTLFFDKPTPKRLASWRKKAQQAAAIHAGFSYNAYAQAKFLRIVDELAGVTHKHRSSSESTEAQELDLGAIFVDYLTSGALNTLSGKRGGASDAAIAFFRTHDLGFRIRRLRLIVRHLSRDWDGHPEIDDDTLDQARDTIYRILALYFDRDGSDILGEDFARLAKNAADDPGSCLKELGKRRLLAEIDERAEVMLADALAQMPDTLRRCCLHAYLGFPYYDVATLPLLTHVGGGEINTIKVDRISPDDAPSIRDGGARATLRGIEFYNFGAFFSRAYRENDYLWGRLHGAERMIDLIASSADGVIAEATVAAFKKRAFLAILDEEAPRLKNSDDLIAAIRNDIANRL